jgi:hypothetical protein
MIVPYVKERFLSAMLKAPAYGDRRAKLSRRARLHRAVRNVPWENVGLAVAVLVVAALWGGVIVLWWVALM